MITALVQFSLPQPVTRDKAREIFSGTAPRYRDTPGLIRKYYLLSQDGQMAGGVYLWKSRADAERLYTDEWRQFVRGRYGTEPSVTYFETPVVVDNLAGQIVTDA
jgi:Putative mono-oxygenase ydhR